MQLSRRKPTTIYNSTDIHGNAQWQYDLMDKTNQQSEGKNGKQDGPLWSATLNGPTCVIVDQKGHLIVGTQGSLRMIDIQNNMVSTVWKCDGNDILCLEWQVSF